MQDKLRRLIISLFFFVLAQCDLAKMVSAQSDSENENRASSPTIVDFEKVDLIIVWIQVYKRSMIKISRVVHNE